MKLFVSVDESVQVRNFAQLARLPKTDSTIQVSAFRYLDELLQHLHELPDVIVVVDDRSCVAPALIGTIRDAGYAGAIVANTWPGNVRNCFQAGATDTSSGPLTDADTIAQLWSAIRSVRQVRCDPKVKCFVSHSSADHDFARSLAASLSSMQIPVWYDEWQLKAGDSIISKIEDGISNADILLVVLSPTSVASNWVTEELRSFLHRQIANQKCAIIPVLLAECIIPAFLVDRVYCDFRGKFDDGVSQITTAIQATRSRLAT